VLTIDLKQPAAGWKSHRQPFYRRALQAAAFQNRVYVAGGLDDGGSIIGAVSIYDAAANSWTDGPELPGGKRVGFNPAICVANNRLYVSVADGVIGRLSTDGKSWEPVAKVAPRIVHRMVAANDDTLLLIGGATKGDNLETVEAVKIGK
jgi:N-acetylneuraminic acid mutarotase